MLEKPTYEKLKQRISYLEKALAKNSGCGIDLFNNQKVISDIIENSGALIVIKDCEGKNLLVNRKWEEVTGLKRENAIGKTDEELFPPAMAWQFRINDLRVIESGKTIEVEEVLNRPSGPLYFISIKFPLFDDTGDIIGLCGIITDITQRKLTEEALRISEKKYQSMFHNAQIALFKNSIDGKIIDINQRYAEMAGYSSVEECLAEFNPAEAWADPKGRDECINILRKKGSVKDYETEIIRKDGSRIWILFSAKIFPKEGTLEGSIVDITQRKQTERSLRESEARFKALHNASFGGITIHDKGIILECNRGLADITGYSIDELIGMDGLRLIAEKSRELVMQNILRGYEKPYEAFGVRKNGEEYPIRLEGRNIPYKGKQVRTVEFRDITEAKRSEEERKKLQDQLTQAQKMESMGRLAGGVAHDFNNMLGVILGYTELTLENIDPSSPLHANLQEIHHAAKRSVEITRQLLAFARQQTVAPRMLDLNDTIGSMLKMLQRLIGEDIELAWEPDPDLWPVKMDPAQIDQILANFCVNARDAISNVGRVIITTHNICIGEENQNRHEGVVSGDYVMLTFIDDGCGMTKEVLANLFEPFYTTKDVHEGTGLGLATVYGIVKQNQGFINVRSEPGMGTTFRIYLPCPSDTGEIEKQAEQKTSVPEAQKNETILLVEDEPAILNMATIILKKLGYTVLALNSPEKAVTMAGEYPGEIHLLITDVVMPKMNGKDLARNLLSLYPGLKCLFMSGYTANVIAQHGVLDEGVQFIQKPFTKQDLGTKVRDVLDQTDHTLYDRHPYE